MTARIGVNNENENFLSTSADTGFWGGDTDSQLLGVSLRSYVDDNQLKSRDLVDRWNCL